MSTCIWLRKVSSLQRPCTGSSRLQQELQTGGRCRRHLSWSSVSTGWRRCISHLVSYFSAKFKTHQLNYSTMEKETLAMLFTLQHFEVYVGSTSPVIVYTDHNPLVFLKRIYNHDQQLMRWALLAKEYNLDIRHKKGVENVIAYVLSRM